MTRETSNFEDTEFKPAVYEDRDMPKETLSTRVHPFVAEQVERYAETHDLSRTDTLELLIETGVERGGEGSTDRTYTVLLSEDMADEVERVASSGNWGHPNKVVSYALQQLTERDAEPPEDADPVALSARLPPSLVERVVEWGESQDVTKAVAAERLIESGLKADPLPESYDPSGEGVVYTARLDAETADLLRRRRLEKRVPPEKAIVELVGVYVQGKQREVPVGWVR